MLSMLMIFTLMTLIPALLLTMNSTLSKKTLGNLEKSSPFECGFDPQALSRLPFSVQFFLVSMIFLIFDVEITLLLPIVTLTPTSNMSLMVLSCSFIMILTLGLYFEYLDKSIEWQK